MGRRVMAVLAAVVVGLIGVAAVLVYAKGADSRAVAGQRPQSVFVAQERVPTGTTAADAVAKGLLVPTLVAAKGVPAGALTKVDASNGRLMAVTDIAAGEFVLASRFSATPAERKAIQVPTGQIAMSVALPDPAHVGPFVTPGSRIVIYDTWPKDEPARAKTTRVLAADALVIAVGSKSLSPAAAPADEDKADGKSQSATDEVSVTVALPPDLAVKLAHGIQTGTLYAGLRGTDAKAKLGEVVSGDQRVTNK